MTIRWDALMCAAISAELGALLSGGRARAVLLDRDHRTVALFLRKHTLVAELGAGWIGTLPPREPPSAAHRLRHRVRDATSPFDESAIALRLAPSGSGEEPLVLTLELIGTRRNALVVREPDGVIRHVLSPRDTSRTLRVGATYEPPEPTGRSGRDQVTTRSGWDRLLAEAASPEIPPRRRILETIAWTSSLNVDWLLEGDPWGRWRTMTEPDGWGGFMVAVAGGRQPYPVPLTEAGARTPAGESTPTAPGGRGPAEPFPGLLAAFRAARSDSGAPSLGAILSPDGAVSRAAQALERTRKRARALERELERAPDPATLRGTGDLILARLKELRRGARHASLTDFLGEPVEVRLDPALTPAENADAYYRRAGRAERARESLPTRIERARAEAARIEGLLEDHETGDLSDESLLAGLGPAAAGRSRRQREEGPPLPYRSLWSSGGLEIRVGRGARYNDDLTFHHSVPEDIWLHALQTSGAHVILRWGKVERPPRRDLTEAAALAALNSGARHAGSVAVGWTRRKYVRKPRGAAPGAVVPDRVETVFVSPDPSLPERLGDTAPDPVG